MKLVSAAKLAKAQQAIQSSKPYAGELEDTIKTISALVENYSHQYLNENKENKRAALLVISANKGLCGGYNSQLAKEVKKFLADTDIDVKTYFISKKVRELILSDVNEGKFYEFEKIKPSYLEIQEVAKELDNLFSSGEFGKVYITYNIFKSAIEFVPTVKATLPITLEEEELKRVEEDFPFDFKYDPSPEALLDTLIPEAYMSTVYTCILDELAAEHGSHISTMDSTVSNCKDAIRTQTLKINKLRQAAITTKLIEVVSSTESLKG